MNNAQGEAGLLAWEEHCCGAARKFLMNAVVIDNEPFVPVLSRPAQTQEAEMLDDGMGVVLNEFDEEEEGEEQNGSESQGREIGGHELDIRSVSDAFAADGIACAFVLPDDGDEDEEAICSRVLNAASASDIVVIDWHLRRKSADLTKKILTELAQHDAAESGRMRLICVYTGETVLDAVTRDAIAVLEAGGMNFTDKKLDEGAGRGEHNLLLVLNKRDVASAQLPERLIREFSALADGLLPAFSLAAVAAIRRNVHHIATRFSAELDAAYVANRLITDPPGDVAELIRELFVSECDTALGLERVADNYLEPEQLKSWLAARGQPQSKQKFGKEEMQISANFLIGLADGRVDGEKSIAFMGDGKEFEFKENARQQISRALHKGKNQDEIKGKSIDTERQFARFVALKREAFGGNKLISGEGWKPSLTLGTIVARDVQVEGSDGPEMEKEFYYCLTPACDTVRANNEVRRFLFLRLSIAKNAKEKGNLIIAIDGSNSEKLFVDPRPSKISVFDFKGDAELGRVIATKVEDSDGKNPQFKFVAVDDTASDFEWLGEVRGIRAQRDMTDLNREWLRFGILDSEYLRLASKKSAAL